jgi:tetratricopeptide (TPR) repeat protein
MRWSISCLAVSALFFAANLGTFGCRSSSPPATREADRPLGISFAGCGTVLVQAGERTCELGETRRLRLVIPEAARGLVVRVGAPDDAGAELPLLVATDGGAETRFVDVPSSATRLVARATVAGHPASQSLRIASMRTFGWIEESKALRAKGDLAGARAVLERQATEGDERASAAKTDLLARITLAEGHAAEAFPLFRSAIASHRAAGRLSDAIDDSFALAFALHQREARYDEARAALDAVSGDVDVYPEGRAREPYYRGLLASETGDRRKALALLREAESRAHALEMTRLERNARAALALEMQALGRISESLDVLRGLERDPNVTGCERVEIANDLGWGALLANEAAGTPHEDARRPLERAVAAPGCSDAYVKSFALANLARIDVAEGNAAAATAHLTEARAAVKAPRGTERLAWLDLEATILLTQRKAEAALAKFDEQARLARAALLLEPEWRAMVGRGEALDALGRRAEALESFEVAERLLDQAMLLVPLGEGRGAFVTEHSRSARLLVELLLALHRNADAAQAARSSRARVLSGVERAVRIESLGAEPRARWEAAVRSYRAARDAIDAEAAHDWELPADAFSRVMVSRRAREQALRAALEAAMVVLGRPDDARRPRPGEPSPPLAEGDLELVIHPGKTGWIAIVTAATGTTWHRVGADLGAPPERLAAALLDPIATPIEHAKRLRVRAFGAWKVVDVHALPFHGEPLLVRLPIDYPIGLRGDAEESPFDRRAVVVGDPSGNLPGARAEALFAAGALGDRMPSRLLVGSDATSGAVGAALPRAGLLHYAGHGVFSASDGLATTLELAEGSRLSAGDVFALAPAPRKVVLSGCDAARTLGGDDLGLAQALVTAGSEEVLAPARAVSDILAEKLAHALYAGAALDGVSDVASRGTLASAARLAILAVRRESPELDWQVFRVLAR